MTLVLIFAICPGSFCRAFRPDRLVRCTGEIEAQLADYRADIVDVDGGIVRAIDLACPGDEIAKEHARSLVDGHDVELWYGSRLVAKFKHELRRRGVS